MTDIQTLKNQIDLATVIENSGIDLTSKYGRHVCRCPFHADERPSFFIYETHFHCYGCGAHGDVIDFIQRLHKVEFKEACRLLGIRTGRPAKGTRENIVELQKKRREREQYKRRESDLAYTLGCHIRWIRQVMNAINTIEDLEAFSDYLHGLPFFEYCHHILSQGDREQRREVVSALKDLEVIERNKIFSPDFDFPAWLREFTGAQHEKKCP
jgi:hypothetical protein